VDIGQLAVDILRIVWAILLLFLLPGYFMVKAMFPGRRDLDDDYNELYCIGLGMAMSIALSILVGFTLGGLLPKAPDGRGYLTNPYIEISMVLLILVFFAAAWYRGAFPALGRLHPALLRMPAEDKERVSPEKRTDEIAHELRKLIRDREMLRKELRTYQRRMKTQSQSMRSYYKAKMEEKKKEIIELDARISELEAERSEELAEGKA